MSDSKKKYSVVVGNVGTVYDGKDYIKAKEDFDYYVELSKLNLGRVAGENVTMFCNDEIKKEYNPPLSS